MGVKLQSSSGGSVDITAPVTASNYVLTAPATNGTILNDASSLAAANLTGDVAAARITNALNASGSAPVYACRAWVNFNGTGTVAIRASGNVSSITDYGTGQYGINFTIAMIDANYVCSGMTGDNRIIGSGLVRVNTESACKISTQSAGAFSDEGYVFVAIIR